MSANDTQVGGTHYAGAVQHWDYAVAQFGTGYLKGQITKYVCRWRFKNGVQDLKKAAHFIHKLQEVERAACSQPFSVRGFVLQLLAYAYTEIERRPIITIRDIRSVTSAERKICSLIEAGDLKSLARAAIALKYLTAAAPDEEPARGYVDPDGQDSWEQQA